MHTVVLYSLEFRRQKDGGIDAKSSLLGRGTVAAFESSQAVIVTGLVSYREQVKKSILGCSRRSSTSLCAHFTVRTARVPVDSVFLVVQGVFRVTLEVSLPRLE